MSSRIHPLGAVPQVGGKSGVTASHPNYYHATKYHKAVRVDWNMILTLTAKECGMKTWTTFSFQLDSSENITNYWGL
jgi:hypothetical protein